MPKFAATDGTELYYEDSAGNGGKHGDAAGRSPILCLSGLTRTTGDFAYVSPHLAGHRLIKMDYRGRGQSDWARPESYTIPAEAADALALLDHLQIEKAALLGTSRGGLIGLGLAATAPDRLLGLCLNDIGPEIMEEGMQAIRAYLGKRPAQKTYEQATQMRAALMQGFANVPESRWAEEVRLHYVETPKGLDITYDPALRQAVLASADAPQPDLWPFFDATIGLPLALIRGANSNLLSAQTAQEMRRRRPDMEFAEVADRGHVPFLDEPESLACLNHWIRQIQGEN